MISNITTPRRSLSSISSNIIRKKQRSPYTKGQIVGAFKNSTKVPELQKLFGTPETTLRRIIRIIPQRPHGSSNEKPGRPIEYNERQVRQVLRFVRNNPKTSYAAIKKACVGDFSIWTIKCILRLNQVLTWRAKKRPQITEVYMEKRLAWAIVRRDWTKEDFYKFMWSNECSIEQDKGKQQEWAFGCLKDKWKKEYITTYHKGKDISIMVWACFWYKDGAIQRSQLYIMDRDFKAKKHRYSANSYLEVLDENLPNCWSPGLVFICDGASIYTTRKVTQYFIDMGIPFTNHPPFSPDTNPIEHI